MRNLYCSMIRQPFMAHAGTTYSSNQRASPATPATINTVITYQTKQECMDLIAYRCSVCLLSLSIHLLFFSSFPSPDCFYFLLSPACLSLASLDLFLPLPNVVLLCLIQSNCISPSFALYFTRLGKPLIRPLCVVSCFEGVNPLFFLDLFIMASAKLAKLPKVSHAAGIFADISVDGPAIGTLVAVVDRAKNLPNRKTMGKQNPYCAARLGKEARKTETDWRGGQTPRWYALLT